MKLEKQKILINIDDTILKSSEEVIRQINEKNGTSKTIDDLKDLEYRSIDKNITQEDLNNMYSSDDFFHNVNFNDGAIEFIKKYNKIFDLVFVSYGTGKNLEKKAKLLTNLKNKYQLDEIYFVACENGKANKSDFYVDHAYVAIDCNSNHLEEINAPKKILLKNSRELQWNQTPINNEITYVANSFKDINDMIEFDLKLKDMGVWLDA